MVTPKRVPPRPPRAARTSGGPAAPRQAPFPSRQPSPSRFGRRGTEQVIGGIALLIVGVFVGAGVIGLINSPPSAPIDSSAPSDAPTDDTGALPSDGADESVAPVSPVLEARLPTSINGATLTVQSAVDATTLSSSPDGRALNAAIVHLGKQASDLEIAVAYDGSGSLDISILGFRADGIAARDLRTAVLSAWLAASTPGVASTTASWSGTEVTKISYNDAGTDEYVITIGDSVFVVETADPQLAQTSVALLTGSPVPSFSTAPAATGASDAPASPEPSPTA